jgi:hypothetical protein
MWVQEATKLPRGIVTDLNDLPDAIGRQHPFDRLLFDQKIVLAADACQENYLPAYRCHYSQGSELNFPRLSLGSKVVVDLVQALMFTMKQVANSGGLAACVQTGRRWRR